MDNREKRFLIVKTSSLGDIIQSFGVLNYIHKSFPRSKIDWVVEERFSSIVSAHPLVNRSISFDIKSFKKKWKKVSFWRSLFCSIRALKTFRYEAVFDLQGNCKSGVITFLSRAVQKIGFGRKSVREWPNIIATQVRFEIPRSINIRLQYLMLIQRYFRDDSPVQIDGVRFKISDQEKEKLSQILSVRELDGKMLVMVCPGSKWINKQLPIETLASFLGKMEGFLHCAFILVWGADEEREMCLAMHRRFINNSVVVDRMDLPLWQNLMNEANLVIAVDSSALHLCGTTKTPSFSIFGPTMPEIFKPVGKNHLAFRGICPYLRTFEKQCPLLRSCTTGACIRDVEADTLFQHFRDWWKCV